MTCPGSMKSFSVLPENSKCSLLVNHSQNLLAVAVKVHYLNPCTQGKVCAVCVCVYHENLTDFCALCLLRSNDAEQEASLVLHTPYLRVAMIAQ